MPRIVSAFGVVPRCGFPRAMVGQIGLLAEPNGSVGVGSESSDGADRTPDIDHVKLINNGQYLGNAAYMYHPL